MFTDYADVAALAVGLVLPAIVALFTKPSTNSTVKAVAHAVLATGTGFYAVYRIHPSGFLWAPAVVAAFLAWLSGTTFYQSLLKRYTWFAGLQNTLVSDAERILHIAPAETAAFQEYLPVVVAAELAAPVTNDFPLSTDTGAFPIVNLPAPVPLAPVVPALVDATAYTQVIPAPVTPAV
jgi:hypothetical protein